MHLTTRQSQLYGTVEAIPSKSFVHRMLICAMLSKSGANVLGCGFCSEDIRATLGCVLAMGCGVDGEKITVPTRLSKKATLDCNQSGSTLRFLLPVLCALGGEYRLIGSKKLLSRPMSDLIDVLLNHGATVVYDESAISVSGKLCSGEFSLRGDVSSQFITGLLLALPILDGDSVINVTTPLASQSYVDVTLEVMKCFGVFVRREGNSFYVSGGQTYDLKGKNIRAEGDWSNVAFWVAGAALGGQVEIVGVNANSVQGDKKILDIAKSMGAEVRLTDSGVLVCANKLNAIEIDVDQIVDLVPILAVMCANASGVSVLKNVSRLRFKESDRVSSVIHLINSLGGTASENADNIIIFGGGLRGGNSYSHNDHRIAMSAMIAGLKTQSPVTVHGVEAINKSYPSFKQDYVRLGGVIDVDVEGE